MATLMPDRLALVRAEIGTQVPPSDDDLDEIYARRGGLVGVIREVWSGRLARLIATPASFTIPGDYGQSTGENIRAIREKLTAIAHLPDDSDEITTLDVVTIAQLVRADRAR